MKKKIHLIPSTHWDYEWYFTEKQTGVLFDFHMEELIDALETNKIDKYLLDGQTGIVEKYLIDNPHKREAMTKLVKEGKLLIGPWYVQNDQMIISGESMIRNLNIGHDYANGLGGVWKNGYVPDSFGQSIDAPKLYNGFDIHNHVFWRGMSQNKIKNREFTWRAQDGSSVKSYNIKEGYYSGGAMMWGEKDFKTMKELADKTFKYSSLDSIHFSVAGDQRYVDHTIKEEIKKFTELYPEYEVTQDSYDLIFEKFNNETEIYYGEMLDGSDSKIHRSIYSNRYDHKKDNDELERLITNVLEPLSVMGREAGIDIRQKVIEEAWRFIILNSAHDSAGACNSDETNRYIAQRFHFARDLIESYIDIIVRKVSEAKGGDILTLFNTLGYTKPLNETILINTKEKDFTITEKDGIKFKVISQEKVYSGSIQRDDSTNDPSKYYYQTKVYVTGEMEPMSIKYFDVKEEGELTIPVFKKGNKIENKNYEIIIGKNIQITNKVTGEVIENALSYTHEADDGDNYDWSYLENQVIRNFKIDEDTIEIKDACCHNEISFESILIAPKTLEENVQGKETTELKIKTTISINRTKNITVKASMDNTVSDHRVRAILNARHNKDNLYSDTPFGFIQRPFRQVEMDTWKELKWKEEPSAIYPTLGIVSSKGQNQFNAYLMGIKEYEFVEEGKLALTMMRSVSWLGKPELIRRPGIASGQQFKYIPTPDSRMLEKMEWTFSINFEELENSELRREKDMYTNTVAYFQNQQHNLFTGPIKYFVMHPNKKFEIEETSLLKDNFDKRISISIIKAVGDKTLVRFINQSNEEVKQSGNLTINKDIDSVTWVNMNNELISKAEFDNSNVNLGEFKPGQIKQLIF